LKISPVRWCDDLRSRCLRLGQERSTKHTKSREQNRFRLCGFVDRFGISQKHATIVRLRSLDHTNFPGGSVVPAVINEIAVFVDELKLDLVFAGNPSAQPDRFPLIDELSFATVN